MSALMQLYTLTKSYGSSRGIIDVTFEIAEGKCLASWDLMALGRQRPCAC
jgi:ABC-type phosphonate transport system ATPase subunit